MNSRNPFLEQLDSIPWCTDITFSSSGHQLMYTQVLPVFQLLWTVLWWVCGCRTVLDVLITCPLNMHVPGGIAGAYNISIFSFFSNLLTSPIIYILTSTRASLPSSKVAMLAVFHPLVKSQSHWGEAHWGEAVSHMPPCWLMTLGTFSRTHWPFTSSLRNVCLGMLPIFKLVAEKRGLKFFIKNIYFHYF